MSATTNSYPAEPRTVTGSKAAQKLRAAGKIPLTVTKAGKPSQLLTIDTHSAKHLAAHVVHLCKLDVKGGGTVTALRSQIDTDCITDAIRHIDLIEVDEKSEIRVDVVVHPDARNCPGVKAGGIVELRMRRVKVLCKANAIPDSLELNLDNVQITETVFADQIKLPAGVKLAVPPKQPVLTVVIPREMLKAEEKVAAAPTPEAAAAAAAAGTTPAAGGDAAAPAAAGAKPDAKPAAPAAKADDKKKK